MSDFVENRKTSLREVGKDEYWLQNWITEKPERLKLGSLEIVAQELSHYKNGGGRLDIQGFSRSTNTYYEIEVMLGECDSDHGFRCLDYWAREKVLKPNSLHYAVLVAENLQGRYKTLIETLPQYIPFIAIEIRTLLLETANNKSVATAYAEIIAQPDELIFSNDSSVGPTIKSNSLRDEKWWRENSYDGFVDDVQKMYKITETNIGNSRIDFTASSYISLKKGRRAWLPMWPRKDGFYIYLPDDGTGTVETPSDRFIKIQERLKKIGIEAFWSYKYNAGSNPIGMAISRELMENNILLEILKESYLIT